MANQSPDLSIIILNYNVKELLLNCLESIFKNKDLLRSRSEDSIALTRRTLPFADAKRKSKDKWQIIVVDNASSDGSVEAVKKQFPQVELIVNEENLGFAVGNNEGVKKAKAPVLLFLNPDTVIVGQAIQKSYQYLMSNPDIGALTCRVELPDGKLDYSCHRGFPTPWNSFCYFTGLSKLFPHSPIFAGYTASYLDTKASHQIDCLTGAFMMVRRIAGEQIGFWDTDYFFNGEDVEFCFQLKQKEWQIWFYPEVKIKHFKGSSSGLWSTAQVKVDKDHMIKIAKHGVSAMRIFYMKHYYKNYPPIVRDLILLAIKSLEHYRKFKIRVQ